MLDFLYLVIFIDIEVGVHWSFIRSFAFSVPPLSTESSEHDAEACQAAG